MGRNNSGKSTILAAIGQLLGNAQLPQPILNKFVNQSNNSTIELQIQLTSQEWENLLRVSNNPPENNTDLQNIIPELESSIIIVRHIFTFIEGKQTRDDWKNEISKTGNYSNEISQIIMNAVNKLRDNTLKQFANISYLATERNFQQSEQYMSYNKLIGNEQRNQFIRSTLFHLKEKNRGEFDKITEQIKNIFPEIDEIDIQLDHEVGNFEFKIRANGQDSDINEMGSGTKSLVLILSLILFPNTKIAILDEPDINLHDNLVSKLAKFLDSITPPPQIIIASHHPTFINEFNKEKILHVKSINDSAGTVSSIVEENPVSEILEDLGIPQGNFERAKTSESKVVILTEGPSDEEMLQAFVSRLEKSDEIAKLSPVFHPREGKKHLEYDILDKTNGSPVPFLLIYDKDEMSESEIESKEQELRDRIHVLTRREIENYCLDYETLFDYVKEFQDKKSDEINQKIKALKMVDFKSKIFSLSEELKQKTILMGFKDKIPQFHLIDRKEIHSFIERNRNKTSIEAVDDIFQNLFKKFSDIKHEKLRKIIAEEENRISAHWTETGIFQICPGKDLINLINKWLNAEFKINFSPVQIIKKLKTVDPDMSLLISKIISLGNNSAEQGQS